MEMTRKEMDIRIRRWFFTYNHWKRADIGVSNQSQASFCNLLSKLIGNGPAIYL